MRRLRHTRPLPSQAVLYVDLNARQTHLLTHDQLPERPAHSLRFVCLSDTHSLHDAIDPPPGDVLVHSGDLTFSSRDFAAVIESYEQWCRRQPHRVKFFTPGNHDAGCQSAGPDRMKQLMPSVVYGTGRLL